MDGGLFVDQFCGAIMQMKSDIGDKIHQIVDFDVIARFVDVLVSVQLQ
jgi:hypothetical protein